MDSQAVSQSKANLFNGKSLAVLITDFIYEVVYVETDVDTDFDDQADLVKVEIIRPAESIRVKSPRRLYRQSIQPGNQ